MIKHSTLLALSLALAFGVYAPLNPSVSCAHHKAEQMTAADHGKMQGN